MIEGVSPLPAHGRIRWFSPWQGVFVLAWLAVFLTAFPDPLAVAQRHWPLALVGFAGAVLGNATAVGGGLVFVPVMMLVYGLDPVRSLQLALVSQAVGMTSGAFGWLSRRAVPLELLPVAVPALLVGSTLSTLVVRPNPLLVKGMFGPASVFVGLVVLYLLDRHPVGVAGVPRRAWPALAAVALVGGVLTGWVAIGEGEVVAAFLMLAYGLSAERGIGLGTVLLSINSIFLAVLHAFIVGGVPWEMAAFTMLGCAFGGRMGPFLTQWVPPRRLKVGFAALAIADGLLMTWQFLRSFG
jgi:uncharacterized membrane protein YfcA